LKNTYIGGGTMITVQSMTSTKTEDTEATVKEIGLLADAGCDIIRCAVNTEKAAESLKNIVNSVSIPVVADVHFDYRLALAAIKNGASKLRINPSNIGSKEKREVIAASKSAEYR
jgi:(E)-4-hydroxy-3-methylbut-2-enyl-diphosphate synthase